MIEILGLGALAVVVGGVLLLAAMVALPLWLAFKAIGFVFRLVFGAIGFLACALGALLLLPLLIPLLLLAGAVVLLKLVLLLALPLLFIGLVVWGLSTLFRPAPA